jgi:uncharacterized protein YbjT (DUF2867 family)
VTLPQSILITGALGFVASRLMPRLSASGARLVALVRPGRDVAALERDGIEVRRADLADPTSFGGAFDQVEAVIHLAGLSLVPPMVPELERSGVRRGVFVSSAGVHTRLASSGADAKRRGEGALRESSLDWVILRPSMIYGTPGDRNLARLLAWLDRFPVLPLPGGGATLQQPVHVDDLCSAIIESLARPQAARREYDLGGPDALSLSELVRVSAEALGRSVWCPPLPLGPVHAGVRAVRAMGVPFPVRPEQVLRLHESKAVDIGPAVRDLGFSPRAFRDGIRAEVAMLRDRARTRATQAR